MFLGLLFSDVEAWFSGTARVLDREGPARVLLLREVLGVGTVVVVEVVGFVFRIEELVEVEFEFELELELLVLVIGEVGMLLDEEGVIGLVVAVVGRRTVDDDKTVGDEVRLYRLSL